MKVTLLSIFPDFFASPLETSFFRRARESGAWEISAIDLREFATGDLHRATDDTPTGGGPGMVMLLEPLCTALETLIAASEVGEGARGLVLLSASGPRFTQATAHELAQYEELILICGHYEGVDERLLQLFPIRELCIGDYVLTGGESAALVVVDALVRLLPQVLGNPESLREESFETGILDHPVYTKPAVFRGLGVPDVLLSGHHARISEWRRAQALEKTLRNRPDLLPGATLTAKERAWVEERLKDAPEASADTASDEPTVQRPTT